MPKPQISPLSYGGHHVSEILELTDIIKKIGFINYNHAGENRVQAVKDWLRNEKHIYIQGKQFKEILDAYRLQHFQKELRNFLDNGNGEKEEREHALGFFIMEVLKSNHHPINSEQINFQHLEANAWFATLFDDLQKDGFDLEKKFDASDEGPLNVRKYEIENESKAIVELKQILKSRIAKYLIAEHAADNVIRLAAVWKKHLFNKIENDEDKEKLTAMFFDVAHQGGFMHVMSTGHIQHLIALQNDFFSVGAASMAETRIDFSTHGQEIDVVEKLPFVTLYHNSDVENQLASSRIADMEIRHNISLQDGEVKLKITAARDYLYDVKIEHPETGKTVPAGEIILGPQLLEQARLETLKQKKLGHFMAYANQYLKKGHDAILINELFARYKDLDIERQQTVKNIGSLQRLFQPGQETHHRGDNILAALGTEYPEYAEMIAANIKKQASEGGKHYFEKSLKLLVRLGREDLAKKIILQPLSIKASADKAYMATYAEFSLAADKAKGSFFRRGYDELLKIGFLSPAKSEIKKDLQNYADNFILEGRNDEEMNRLLHKHKELHPGMFVHDDAEQREKNIFKKLAKYNPDYLDNLSNNLSDYALMGEMPYVRALQVMINMDDKKGVKEMIIHKIRALDAVLAAQMNNDKDLLTEPGLRKVYSKFLELGYLPEPRSTPKNSIS